MMINLRTGLYRIDEGIKWATKKDESSECTTMIKTYTRSVPRIDRMGRDF